MHARGHSPRRRRKDPWVRRVFAACGLLAVAAVVLTWVWWKGIHEFDAARWRAENNRCENRNRKRMVGDLRAHHLTRGMTHAEVETLLGKPDAGTWTDANGALRWSYLTGPSIMDCFVFDVRFVRGRVVGTAEGEN